MGSEAIVVPSGEGRRVGNVEVLARSVDTPRFTFNVHAPAGFDRRIGLPG